MLPAAVRRVFVAEYRIDFRKRFDGLLAEAYRLGADPYEGDCVVFIKKDHTQLRAVSGDRLGLYMICRRFEGGCLRRTFKFMADPGYHAISAGELNMLFEGATFTVHSRAKEWKK